MHSDSTDNPDKQTVDAFELIATTMHDFRNAMEYYDILGTRIARRTRLIMKLVFATLIASSLYLLFMIFQMSSNMSIMTGHLESMYGRFGSMSGDMREITRLVDSMGKSVSGIPAIATSMMEMNQHVGAMSGSVQGMNGSITAIDTDMVRINSHMQEMTGRVSGMSRAVNSMSYDVDEMAAPMNSGPMSGFWPR